MEESKPSNIVKQLEKLMNDETLKIDQYDFLNDLLRDIRKYRRASEVSEAIPFVLLGIITAGDVSLMAVISVFKYLSAIALAAVLLIALLWLILMIYCILSIDPILKKERKEKRLRWMLSHKRYRPATRLMDMKSVKNAIATLIPNDGTWYASDEYMRVMGEISSIEHFDMTDVRIVTILMHVDKMKKFISDLEYEPECHVANDVRNQLTMMAKELFSLCSKEYELKIEADRHDVEEKERNARERKDMETKKGTLSALKALAYLQSSHVDDESLESLMRSREALDETIRSITGNSREAKRSQEEHA